IDGCSRAARCIAETGPKPAAPIRTGQQKSGRNEKQDGKTQRARITPRQAGRRQRDTKLPDASETLREMKLPQALRPGIAHAGGHRVSGFRNRAGREAAVLLQPPRAVAPAGYLQIAQSEIECEADRGNRTGED